MSPCDDGYISVCTCSGESKQHHGGYSFVRIVLPCQWAFYDDEAIIFHNRLLRGNLLLRASTPAYRMMDDTNDSDSEPRRLGPTLGAGRRFLIPLVSPDE